MKPQIEKQRRRQLRSRSNADLPCSRLVLAKEYVNRHKSAGSIHLDYAIALMELARYKESERELNKAIKACPKEKLHIPYSHMGHLCYFKGNYKEAVSWFSKCIKLRSDDASYYIYKGSVLAKAGKLKAAENSHRRATKCEEGCIDEAYLNLGYVLRAQEKFQEALRSFKKALKLDPKYRAAKLAVRDVSKAIEYGKKYT